MAKNKLITGCLILISLLWVSCVKDPQDIPEGFTTSPVFNLSGVFGTENISIEAGTDAWTMQPIVENRDSNIVYTSIFSLHGCLQQCSPSLEFRFYRDLPSTNNEELNFQQTIQPGLKEYVQPDQERDSFEIILSTHPGLFMSGYSYWKDLNNPGINFQAEYASTLGNADLLNVCFQSLAFTGCQYSQCISFNPLTLEPCIAFIQPKLESPRHLRLIVKTEQGTPPFQYSWSNGETDSNIIIELQDSTNEVYADVTVTDALGNRSELKQIIRVQNGNVDACYFPIELTSTPIHNSSPSFAADRVEVIYTDEIGDVWKSTGGMQTLNSTMSINSVEYFDLSPLNEPAYKTNINMAVQLFNSNTGESRVFTTHGAVIALSHR